MLYLKSFFKFLNKEYPIITNVISIVALFIAISTMNKATKQFNLSNTQSDVLFKKQLIQNDSLFNAQIKQSDSLFNELYSKNDTLINLISKLQNISDKQLNTLNTTLNENKEAGRPIFQFIDASIGNQIISEVGNCTIEIIIEYSNEGNRIASECLNRSFVTFDNYKNYYSEISKVSSIVPPHGKVNTLISAKMPKKFKDDFYLCFELNYYDFKLNEYFVQTVYYHYYKEIMMGFYDAKDNETKLIEVINKTFRNKNKPLWSEFYQHKKK